MPSYGEAMMTTMLLRPAPSAVLARLVAVRAIASVVSISIAITVRNSEVRPG